MNEQELLKLIRETPTDIYTKHPPAYWPNPDFHITLEGGGIVKVKRIVRTWPEDLSATINAEDDEAFFLHGEVVDSMPDQWRRIIDIDPRLIQFLGFRPVFIRV